MKSSKFLSFLEDTSLPKSLFSLFLPISLPSSLQNSENKRVARLKSTSLICGCHLSTVCAKFELGLFIGPIPTLLFLAIAAIIWKPSSFNDHIDLNTTIAAIIAIVWKPGLRSLLGYRTSIKVVNILSNPWRANVDAKSVDSNHSSTGTVEGSTATKSCREEEEPP